MATMIRKFSIDTGDMALALVLWLCSLPVVGLFVATFFGLKVGAIVAVALFLLTMAICWGICGWKRRTKLELALTKPTWSIFSWQLK